MEIAEKMTGAEAIVKVLEEQGVRYVFGICGHANISMLDALHESSIEFVSVRNEGVAVYMADAYFRASHQIAAVLTTVGPGVSNTVTAVADSMMDSTPVLVIAGDVPNYLIGKGALQEVSFTTFGNQWEILRPVTKRAWRIADVRDVPGSIQRALNIALSGCPGPVAVSVPMDFLGAVGEFEVEDPRLHRPSHSRLRGDREAIGRGADLLASAERPMVLSGNGVLLSRATPELVAVADLLSAPVATTMTGQVGFPKSHELNIECPNSIGNPAVQHAMQTADVVLVVGSRLTEFEANSWDREVGFDPWTRQSFVQIDVDSEMIGKVYPVEVGIVGDAKAVLAELSQALGERMASRRPRSPWVNELLAQLAEWRQAVAERERNDSVPIDPYRVMAELREVLPGNSILHVDPGSVIRYIAGQQLTLDEPGSFYYNAGFGSMGACMATALGAKLARPDKTIVSLVGDGGFTCQMSPVVTAVEHNIPVVWVVLNNFAFNSIEIYQHRHFDSRVYGTTFRDRQGEPSNPDFAALARSCGAQGYRVERPEELQSALRQAMETDRPSVVEVITDSMRYVDTYGWFEANRIFMAEAEFKREREDARARARAGEPVGAPSGS